MSLNKDGYEVLNAKAECEDQYREKSERRMRIMGYNGTFDMDEDDAGGFIPRNNVQERL